MIEGRKVVGSAQLRQGNAFLQHGSLLLDDDQSLVRDLAGFSENGAAEAPLSRLVGRTVTFAEAAEAISTVARETLPDLERGELPSGLELAIARHAEKFRSPDWTWQR